MYIQDFDTFFEKAQQLYEANPLATRYVLKYRNKDGKVVVKITDDTTVSAVGRAGAWRLPGLPLIWPCGGAHGARCTARAVPPRSACNSRRTSRQI